jgi:hypothetical protein
LLFAGSERESSVSAADDAGGVVTVGRTGRTLTGGNADEISVLGIEELVLEDTELNVTWEEGLLGRFRFLLS